MQKSIFGLLFLLTQSLNAHTEVQLKSIYYAIDKEKEEKIYATALGGYLKYTTDTNRGLFTSVRFDTSNPVGGYSERSKTSLFNNDNNAKGFSTLTEAFIGFKKKNHILKLGNIMLKTPMMNDDTTRIVPWSYRGIAYIGEPFKDFKSQLYHIRSMRSNTSDLYTTKSPSGEFSKSGISIVSLHYEGIQHLKLQSFYYYSPTTFCSFFTQADYEYFSNNVLIFCLGVQYIKSNHEKEIDLLALRTLFDTDNWLFSLSYSQNFGVDGVNKGYGGLTKIYTRSMIANGRGDNKPKTWVLKSSYDLLLNNKESEIALWLTHTDYDDSKGDDLISYYFHFKHFFNTDTSLHFRYEKIDYKGIKSDVQYFRTIASYRF